MGDGVPTANVIVWQTGTVGDVNPVLNNLKPDALAEFLSADPKTTPYIKSLKVSGEPQWWRYLRTAHITDPIQDAEGLDLFGARIVSGGKAYLTTALNEQYYTRNDEVGEDMFRDCTSLEKITLPEHLKAIGIQAFANCSSLQGIEIPSTVKSIDSQAFFSCTNMSFIGIPIEGSQLEYLGSRRPSPQAQSLTTCISLPPWKTWADLPSHPVGCLSCMCNGQHRLMWWSPSNLPRARLYVPKGSKAAYAADKNWGKFSDIQEE